MKILNGKEVAASVRLGLKQEIQGLVALGQSAPGLAVVLVGDDPASQVYVGSKIKACQEIGISSFEFKMPKESTMQDLKRVLDNCAANDQINGILVQLPLPPHLDASQVLEWIPTHKDADGLTSHSLGLLFKGQQTIAPCTPSGVMEILKFYGYDVSGKSVVVVGRSQIVGLPMAQLMIQAHATVTVVHSKTVNSEAYIKAADIVVVAAGKPKLFGRDHFKKEAIVIDVGIHRDENNKLCGDVDPEGLDVQALTPVPGGVGPMTIAMLLKNTVELYKLRSRKIETEKEKKE